MSGDREAARCATWTIARARTAAEGPWVLTAARPWMHPLYLRQRPLYFTAPRQQGFWFWPVRAIRVTPDRLSVDLGPPEQ